MPAAALPSVLTDPPWRRAPSPAESPAVAATTDSVPPRLRWEEGERAAFDGHPRSALSEDADEALLDRLLEQIDRRRPLPLASVRRLSDERLAELGEDLLPSCVDCGLLQLMLARVGDEFVGTAVKLVTAAPNDHGLFVAMAPVDADALAPLAAAELRRRRTHLDDAMTRPFSVSRAERWLERHACAATRRLGPAANDPDAKDHATALAALRWIAVRGVETGDPAWDLRLAPLRRLAPLAAHEAYPWLATLVAFGLDRRALALLADCNDANAVPWVARAVMGPARSEAVEWLQRNRSVALSVLATAQSEEALAAKAILGGDSTAHDPALLDIPQPIPPLPKWLDVGTLPPPCLHDGTPLPPDACLALAEMLRFSPMTRPYAGLAQVQAACTAESLDAFGTALLAAWVGSEESARDRWMLDASGSIGGEGCAREVATLVRRWARVATPPERGWDQDARRQVTFVEGDRNWNYSLTGCTVLAAIGNELALTALDDLARSGSKKWLRRQATKVLGEAMDGKEIRKDRFDDSIVPDAGLDADGSMTFDLGDRQCSVWFDEQLTPRLIDGEGKRLKSFPRPRKADDPEKYAAAKAKYAALRADTKVLARQQIGQLELAMTHGRSWGREAFLERFVQHPLLRHLARRLLWRAKEHGLFRVAEDFTYAGADDEEFVLPKDAELSIVHPADISADERLRWQKLFTDYEVLQPFEQLSREVHTVEDAEENLTHLEQFVGRTTSGGRLFRARRRGWVSADGGWEWTRSLPSGADACFRISPAFSQGSTAESEHVVKDVWCAYRFGRLSAIDYSEFLRDITHLAYSSG